MKNKNLSVRIIAESAVMIALATILSLIKLIEMPYGGSVTLASALPIGIIAYRHGMRPGLASGIVFGVIQQLLGLSNLSYFTTWQSILAVILLDYLVAFAVIGFMGVFRDSRLLASLPIGKRQSAALSFGMLFVMILRYMCHTVSGATVWAGLSIPTSAALFYSLGYNATYMIPEAVIAVSVAAWVGEAIDFEHTVPKRMRVIADKKNRGPILCEISMLSLLLTVIIDTILVFPHLQDPESGEFTFSYLGNVNFAAFLAVSICGLLISAALIMAARFMMSAENAELSKQ